MNQNDANHHMYHITKRGLIAILVLCVDELLMIGNHLIKIDWPKNQLEKNISNVLFLAKLVPKCGIHQIQ
jgi:hypothetical protein